MTILFVKYNFGIWEVNLPPFLLLSSHIGLELYVEIVTQCRSHTFGCYISSLQYALPGNKMSIASIWNLVKISKKYQWNLDMLIDEPRKKEIVKYIFLIRKLMYIALQNCILPWPDPAYLLQFLVYVHVACVSPTHPSSHDGQTSLKLVKVSHYSNYYITMEVSHFGEYFVSLKPN